MNDVWGKKMNFWVKSIKKTKKNLPFDVQFFIIFKILRNHNSEKYAALIQNYFKPIVLGPHLLNCKV